MPQKQWPEGSVGPDLPYITEELWQRVFREKEEVKSIHISSWPMVHSEWIQDEAEAAGDLLVGLLIPVRKHKSQKKVHQNQQVEHLRIFAADDRKTQLERISKDLASAARAQRVSIEQPGPGEPTEWEDITLDIQLAAVSS